MSNFADDVTPVLLTRDEEENIERTLGQLTWARDVIVVDSLSDDRTVQLAQRFRNVRVFPRQFDDHATQWEFAVDQAASPWVLTLDADYLLTPALISEIGSLDPDPATSAYEACFLYAVRGRILRASLYPPRAVLLRRAAFEFYMDGHTQRTRVRGTVGQLRAPIIHDDRKPFGRFLERQRRYMAREAEKIRSGLATGPAAAIRRLVVVAPFAVVVHTLFVKGLILDGWPGLLYAWERFVAEIILSRELIRRRPAGESG